MLDRDDEGFSEYPIQADAELQKYLRTALSDTYYEDDIFNLYTEKTGSEIDDPFSVLILPNNLSLLATMNTSDQSLYPMDSAFKRRWDWEYCPIDYEKAAEFTVVIGEKTYNWRSFLEKVNTAIFQLTRSEDKKIGTFFVKPVNNCINRDAFLNKVLFYLWNDVLKDENPNDESYFFKDSTGKPFTFSDLYTNKDDNDKINGIFYCLNCS